MLAGYRVFITKYLGKPWTFFPWDGETVILCRPEVWPKLVEEANRRNFALTLIKDMPPLPLPDLSC